MLVEMHEMLEKNILERGVCVVGHTSGQLNSIVTRAPLQTKVLWAVSTGDEITLKSS